MHSAYSFLDGASQPQELATRAAELGYGALALTDHDGVYGSLEFAHAAKALGLRAITGAEVSLEGDAHITLLCETSQGYANLCRLLTRAHAGTRREGKESREPLPPVVTIDDVVALVGTGGTTGRPKGVMLTDRNLQTMSSVVLMSVGCPCWWGAGACAAAPSIWRKRAS